MGYEIEGEEIQPSKEEARRDQIYRKVFEDVLREDKGGAPAVNPYAPESEEYGWWEESRGEIIENKERAERRRQSS